MPEPMTVDFKQEVLDRITNFTSWFTEVKNQHPSGADGWVSGRCPLHDDQHASFSFDSHSGGWKCFAGCGSGDIFSYLMAVRGQDFPTVLRELGEEVGFKRVATIAVVDPHELAERSAHALHADPARMAWLRKHRGLTDETIAANQIGWDPNSSRYTIPVRDESGTIVNVRRYSPGKNPKMLNIPGCGSPARLYGVDDLVAQPDAPVVICEGEWDRLLLRQFGFLAVTGTAGVGHFRSEWAAHLEGRDITIIFDVDDAGLAGAGAVAQKLSSGGTRLVKVVQLPLLGTPEDKDVTDFFVRHDNSADDLRRLIAETPAYAPARPLPAIKVNNRQPREIEADAWLAVAASNDPPYLFNRAGEVVRIQDPANHPKIVAVTDPYLRTVLHRCADWVKIFANGETSNAKPPRELPAELLARPDARLPELDGVVATPVYTASGYLAVGPDYDREAQLWVHLAQELRGLKLDPHPSPDAIAAARTLILDDLLVDSPFAEQSDRAHAVAALILPFIRRLIPGCTPLHLIEATTPGSGKTLFADLLCRVATGYGCEPTTVTRNEEESRKKITAVLVRGAPVVLIDNVKEELASAHLAAALTAETWSDRELGHTKMIDLPNRAVWLVTANNPRLSEELVRRAVRIRLAPAVERPEDRETFKHPRIRQWAQEHRAALVKAVLTLVRAWMIAGRPLGKVPLGSFEEWAEILGGILRVAGVEGFLEGRDQFYATADTDGQQWRAFVEVWLQELGNEEVTASRLLQLAEDRELIPFAISGSTPQAQRVKLGNSLRQLRDRRFGNVQVRIGQDRHTKASVYQLCPVQEDLFDRDSTK